MERPLSNFESTFGLEYQPIIIDKERCGHTTFASLPKNPSYPKDEIHPDHYLYYNKKARSIADNFIGRIFNMAGVDKGVEYRGFSLIDDNCKKINKNYQKFQSELQKRKENYDGANNDVKVFVDAVFKDIQLSEKFVKEICEILDVEESNLKLRVKYSEYDNNELTKDYDLKLDKDLIHRLKLNFITDTKEILDNLNATIRKWNEDEFKKEIEDKLKNAYNRINSLKNYQKQKDRVASSEKTTIVDVKEPPTTSENAITNSETPQEEIASTYKSATLSDEYIITSTISPGSDINQTERTITNSETPQEEIASTYKSSTLSDEYIITSTTSQGNMPNLTEIITTGRMYVTSDIATNSTYNSTPLVGESSDTSNRTLIATIFSVPLIYIVTGVGSIVVLGVVAYLAYKLFTKNSKRVNRTKSKSKEELPLV